MILVHDIENLSDFGWIISFSHILEEFLGSFHRDLAVSLRVDADPHILENSVKEIRS